MIVGRVTEKALLEKAYKSDQSEFIAIYGRRRVGKTFLVRETFGDRFTFSYSGMPNTSTKMQLQSFHISLMEQGLEKCPIPENWIEAFHQLATFLNNSEDKRKVVFIDELPWMDGPKSSFLPAFEQFWNNWASARKDILLIVCGSSTSWIINKIIKNHGGLHNRLTNRIALKPFTLAECEKYVKALGIKNMNRQNIIEGYMIFGGVPYYWSQLEKGMTMAQNIDRLFFAPDALFANEFNDLFASLFKNPEPHMSIITALGKKKVGMTRDELAGASKLLPNGSFTRYLEELESCGFIRRYISLGSTTRNSVFQLIDNFTLFYFKFLASRKNNDPTFWSKNIVTPSYYNWCGLAFERVCLLHSDQIKKALGISGIITSEYALRLKEANGMPGAEIDLLFDRADKAITLCEIKYTKGKFAITKSYAEQLWNKSERVQASLKSPRSIFIAMITANGLTENEYSDTVQSSITKDELFD